MDSSFDGFTLEEMLAQQGKSDGIFFPSIHHICFNNNHQTYVRLSVTLWSQYYSPTSVSGNK